MLKPGTLWGCALLLSLAAAPTGVTAAASGSSAVSTTNVAACSFTTSPTLTFTNYDPVVANKTTADPGTATLSVKCTKGSNGATGVFIQLNAGTHFTGSGCSTTRAMLAIVGGVNKFLCYELYTDSGHTDVWNTGTTVPNVDSYKPTTMAATTFTVYGLIPAGQNATYSATAYSDSITVTENT